MGKNVNPQNDKDLKNQFFTGWMLDHENSNISLGTAWFYEENEKEYTSGT